MTPYKNQNNFLKNNNKCTYPPILKGGVQKKDININKKLWKKASKNKKQEFYGLNFEENIMKKGADMF